MKFNSVERRSWLPIGKLDDRSGIGAGWIDGYNMSVRSERKQALEEVREAVERLAWMIGDHRFPRKFRHVIYVKGGLNVRATKLKRLHRPLWLGDDGYIYREMGPFFDRYWIRAKLKKRDVIGIRYITERLELEWQKLRHAPR